MYCRRPTYVFVCVFCYLTYAFLFSATITIAPTNGGQIYRISNHDRFSGPTCHVGKTFFRSTIHGQYMKVGMYIHPLSRDKSGHKLHKYLSSRRPLARGPNHSTSHPDGRLGNTAKTHAQHGASAPSQQAFGLGLSSAQPLPRRTRPQQRERERRLGSNPTRTSSTAAELSSLSLARKTPVLPYVAESA